MKMKIKFPSKIAAKAGTLASKAAFNLKKASPEIAIVVGVVGVVASTIMACKATTKLSEVMEKSQKELDEIHKAGQDVEFKKEHNYTDSDYRRDLFIAHKDRVVRVVKLYGPSVAVGVLSLGSIVFSHYVLRQRIAVWASAYAVLDSQFKSYRKNAVERFGEEVDKELRYGTKKIIEDKNGEKKEVSVIDPRIPLGYSQYAAFFDESSRYWDKSRLYNENTIMQVQNLAQTRGEARGFLFLNEVLQMLDIKPMEDGQFVGWIFEKNNPVGDNKIIFDVVNVGEFNKKHGGIIDDDDFADADNVFLIDFNVDGLIIDRVKKWKWE